MMIGRRSLVRRAILDESFRDQFEAPTIPPGVRKPNVAGADFGFLARLRDEYEPKLHSTSNSSNLVYIKYTP